MTKKKIKIVDLFCGAGGTSTGALAACADLELRHTLTAINHWPVAVSTHTLNHPDAVHFCQSIDTINPRELFKRARSSSCSPLRSAWGIRRPWAGHR
jgi:DNA (cytosine-5)-methyltransferase 1